MREKEAWTMDGVLGIFVIIILIGVAFYSFFYNQYVLAIVFIILAIILGSGITLIQPNQAVVVIFLGRYIGSVRREGIVITVPFSKRQILSLRVRNFNSKRLKVNDINGNPIEIAAVIVFKVVDSAKAMFDVDRYETFVEIQSETAIRSVATKYPYDSFHKEQIGLRSHSKEISQQLARELQERLKVAGVQIMEARLTHLAYATEIAQAMLQRQQARAIIEARREIVEGAVKIVRDGIKELEEKEALLLRDEMRIKMINNLLVTIISDRGIQPTIPTSSLKGD